MAIYGSNFDYGDSPFYKDDGDATPSVLVAPVDTSMFEGDIKLFLERGVDFTADVRMGDREILRDPGLETAMIISLYSDARSGDDDKIPDTSEDRRGWWGDALNEAGDVDGSLLWLDSRLKLMSTTLVLLEEHARKALQWMIDDGVAKEIKITVATISAIESALAVVVVRPDNSVEKFRYQYNWNKQVFGKDG